MTDWYAPNQQAVRADGSGPAEEGDGGPAAVETRKTASKTKATKTETVKEDEDE